MCVIMVVKKDRPSTLMMKKAWGRNDDGAGIAWREKVKNQVLVHWKKDLDESEMEHLCNTVPLPYVAHWRIASCGGVRAELTHPFPIDIKASLALEGKTSGKVLFHNGTWSNWQEAARYAAMQKSVQIPMGKWSDTRAIAWLMSMYGDGFLELLPDQRGVSFGPDNLDVFTGPGWVKINEIWCSNEFFVNYHVPTAQATQASSTPTVRLAEVKHLCQYAGCNTVGNLDGDKRCVKHPKTSFPTNGYAEQAQGVATASPTPFHKTALISLKTAKLLHEQRNTKGQRLISKQLFKAIRKAHGKILQGGKGERQGRKNLERLSKEALPKLT